MPVDRPPRPDAGAPESDVRVSHFALGGTELAVFSYPSPAETSLPSEVAAALTASERHVLSLLLTGHSRAEVAIARGRSKSTVARQIESIHRKLSATSLSELAALCAARPGGGRG